MNRDGMELSVPVESVGETGSAWLAKRPEDDAPPPTATPAAAGTAPAVSPPSRAALPLAVLLFPTSASRCAAADGDGMHVLGTAGQHPPAGRELHRPACAGGRSSATPGQHGPTAGQHGLTVGCDDAGERNNRQYRRKLTWQ